MNTNNTNMVVNKDKLLFPELSYSITGICFEAHNQLGRFSKESQYCDLVENLLKEAGINFQREFLLKDLKGDRADFLINGSIILEAKAKRFLTRDDYSQIQRYLQHSQMKLGLLVNFQDKYIKPKRIVRIDTEVKKRFY